MLKSLSNYHLLFELLHEGKSNIYPDLELIDTKQIIKIIEERADKTFGTNIREIMDWFMLIEDVATDKERAGITTVIGLKILKRRAYLK